MSEGFGLGDGSNDLSGVRGLTDSKVSDARRREPGATNEGRWPEVGSVIRVLLAAFVVVVILGWAITAING